MYDISGGLGVPQKRNVAASRRSGLKRETLAPSSKLADTAEHQPTCFEGAPLRSERREPLSDQVGVDKLLHTKALGKERGRGRRLACTVRTAQHEDFRVLVRRHRISTRLVRHEAVHPPFRGSTLRRFYEAPDRSSPTVGHLLIPAVDGCRHGACRGAGVLRDRPGPDECRDHDDAAQGQRPGQRRAANSLRLDA